MTGKEIMNGEGKDLDGSLDSRLSTNDLIIHAIEWVRALLVLWEKTWWILPIVREEDFCELVKTELSLEKKLGELRGSIAQWLAYLPQENS